MAQVNVSVTSLVSSSWDFFRQNFNWLWQVALLLGIPAVVQALFISREEEISETELESITSISEFSETVFGVSLAQAGLLLFVWLVLILAYHALVYGGGVGTLLQSLRGRKEQVSLGSILAVGTRHLGAVLMASVVLFLIILVGFGLFIVPGLIAAFLLSLTVHFVVDKQLSTGEALKASFRLVKDNASTVLLAYLAVVGITIVVSLVAGLVFSIFGGAVLDALTAVVSALTTTFSLIVVTKLYLALSENGSAAEAKA